MARIAFLENRGKTAFWARVAAVLRGRGHEIGWMVQNPAYAPPRGGDAQIRIPFPTAVDLKDCWISEAVSTDRGRTYFNAGSRHYGYYSRQISRALDRLRPEAVIGEPTLFHELLTIGACRSRGIPYLHPTMARYPGGRFAIVNGGSQIPFAVSGESWDDDRLAQLSDAIASGRSLPSYMAKPGALDAHMRRLRRLGGHLRTGWGWLSGDRYNTPSPWRKLALQRRLRVNLGTWQALARMPADGAGPIVLYPLQMQPEANIDVWGRPFSDQAAVIGRLLAAMPPQGRVAIKANPKSKYEISAELLELARASDRVILLPFDCGMDAAQAACIGAVTVSGTVGFEAVFGRGRCLSLRHPVLQAHFPDFHADSPEEAVARLFDDPYAGRGNREIGRAFLARLVAESFAGTINEPLYDPACIAPANVAKVADALEIALQGTRKARAA